MLVAWLVIVYLFIVVSHELAHIAAARESGLQVTQLQIGRFKPRLVIQPKRSSFALAITPWVLGASVHLSEDSEQRCRELRYRAQAWFTSSGCLVNMVSGFALLGLAFLFSDLHHPHIPWLNVIAAVGCTVIAAILWCFRRGFCAYVMPVVSILLLFAITYAMVLIVFGQIEAAELRQLLRQASPSLELMMAAALAFMLAGFNILPMYGVDGNSLWYAIAKKWWGEKVLTAVAVATMVVAASIYGLGALVVYTILNTIYS